MAIVGWTTKLTRSECNECEDKTKQQIVITQTQLKVGNISIMGFGSRKLNKKCLVCDSINEMTEQETEAAKKLEYYTSPPSIEEETSLSPKRKSKYPIMNKERKEKIKADNRKEALYSLGFGLLISGLILPFSTTIAGGFAIFSGLGALYLAMEDPAKKHQALIDDASEKKRLKS